MKKGAVLESDHHVHCLEMQLDNGMCNMLCRNVLGNSILSILSKVSLQTWAETTWMTTPLNIALQLPTHSCAVKQLLTHFLRPCHRNFFPQLAQQELLQRNPVSGNQCIDA